MTAKKSRTSYHWYYDKCCQGEVKTEEEAVREIEQIIGIPLRGCVKVVSDDGNTAYYYETKKEAEAGLPNSFAWHITRWRREE